MASLVRRKTSPFWYVQHRTAHGDWKRTATRYRIGIGSDTRKARELAAEYSLKEHQNKSEPRENWSCWVDDWLAGRRLSPLTVARYQSSWEHVRKFLHKVGIQGPRYVTYATCMDYMAWRKKNKAGRKKPATLNTAIMELKVLGFIMGEAVRRGFANSNPCRELRIPRDKPREKPELTDDQISTIREALKTEPEWMSDAFELAIHHGCRLSECRVPMEDVDFTRNVIHFRKTKGDKPFTVPIHPGILPLLKRKAKTGAAFVSEVPGNDSKPFHTLFKKLGLVGVSFHSTRVTVVSRMARSPEIKPELARRYVNHSSELVHRIYQRLGAEDLRGISGVLGIPSPGNGDDPQAI